MNSCQTLSKPIFQTLPLLATYNIMSLSLEILLTLSYDHFNAMIYHLSEANNFLIFAQLFLFILQIY
jgi:hypothetical protein